MELTRRKLPFLVLAPAIVAIVGVLAAVSVAALGVFHIRESSDGAVAQRSQLLATTLAERLSASGREDRAKIIDRAARRSGAELLLTQQDGTIEIDRSLKAPSSERIVQLLQAGKGEMETSLGRTRFSVEQLRSPLSHLSIIAFVQAPDSPYAMGSLVRSVATLAMILVGVAALAAWALARDVHADVNYVGVRIAEMANEGGAFSGKPIAVRSLDQVGVLTDAFNTLMERFAAAQRAYRQDLAGAEASDKDRSAFLAALSHELRTPLNAILGFTDVLLSEVDGPLSDEAKDSLNVVRRSGVHLRSLIDDILDLSALESGKLALSRQIVDVYPIAEQVVREAQVTAQSKMLTIQLKGRHAFAYADPRRVRQIISNVVGNAVKFTLEGYVVVEIGTFDEGVKIQVADTGPGIAPEEQDAIFEEYTQLGEATAQRFGTGLGLAITKRLVRMHRGEILLNSELGRGSHFLITLPSDPPLGPSAPRTDGGTRLYTTAGAAS